MIHLLYFILGAWIASLLGLVISRFPERPLLKTASYCDRCEEKLALRDKIPILSQVINRFRCRFCRQPISIFYLLLECLVACLFLATSFSILSVEYLLLICMGVTLAAYDQRELSYPILVWLVFHAFILGLTGYNHTMSIFLLLGLIAAFINIGVGAGDFLFLSSCALSFQLSEILFIIQIASLAGIICFSLKKVKDRLAFIPCLLLGLLLLIFYKLLLAG